MKLSIIGAGNMGGAIARGLSSIRQDISIAISNPSPAKLDTIKTEFPQTEIFTDNRKAIENADIILLAVKPWLIESVLNEIAEQVNFKRDAHFVHLFFHRPKEYLTIMRARW